MSVPIVTSITTVAAVDITDQLLHLIQRVLQHENVVLGQEEGGDLGQSSHGGAVGVGHHLPESVQGRVEIVHPLALPGVDL